MKRLNILLTSLLIAATLLAAIGSLTASAETPTVPSRIELSTRPVFDLKNQEVEGKIALVATLTTADGEPLNNQPVLFYQEVELLGPRVASLGTATTDSTGVASIVFEPAQAGPQKLGAAFQGTEQYDKASIGLTLDIKSAVPPMQEAPLPLGPVRRSLPFGIGFLVLATWAVLLGVLLRTIVVVRTAANAPDVELEPEVVRVVDAHS